MAKLKLTTEEYSELCADFPALKGWTPNGSSDWADLCEIFGGALPQRLMWAIVDHKKAQKATPKLKRAKGILERFS